MIEWVKAGVETGKFRDATGLSADESSRWIEVAGDHRVASDSLEASIGRMNKTAGPDLFKSYGIEIGHAKDGTIDANATFLNAIDRLNKIDDPLKQAQAGAAIFGKGWQGMAELIGAGAPQIRDDLASVQPEKIFTDKDIDAATGVRRAAIDAKYHQRRSL